MDKVIATVVILVVVLGLIAYAIFGQVEGVKRSGDTASNEQQKMEMMMKDSNIISASAVRNYINQLGAASVVITNVDGTTAIKDSSIYKITNREYNGDGSLKKITVAEVDLGSNKGK